MLCLSQNILCRLSQCLQCGTVARTRPQSPLYLHTFLQESNVQDTRFQHQYPRCRSGVVLGALSTHVQEGALGACRCVLYLDLIELQAERESTPPHFIGTLLTAGVLCAGLVAFRMGNSQVQNYLMKARVAAQGATLAGTASETCHNLQPPYVCGAAPALRDPNTPYLQVSSGCQCTHSGATLVPPS
jgi:hypoxia induced protein